MAYIGRGTDKISNIEKLDTITFDGSSSYTLQKNSVNFTPNSANSLQVSIDGVVQAGNFTVSGSTIDFGVAIPATSTNDFIFHYGTGLITTPADGTVGLAQLSATGTKDSTTFLRGDNTFAEAGGGKLLQFVTATASSTTVSSTSDVTTNLTTSITPTGTSNKLFIQITSVCYQSRSAANNFLGVNLKRNIGGAGASSVLGGGNNDFLSVYSVNPHTFIRPVTLSYVDTTYNSTSSINYELFSRVESSGEATIWNYGIGGRITIMEIE